MVSMNNLWKHIRRSFNDIFQHVNGVGNVDVNMLKDLEVVVTIKGVVWSFKEETISYSRNWIQRLMLEKSSCCVL